MLAIFGLFLVLLGFYFIYWPIALIVGGLVIMSYCLITVWNETKKDKDNEFN